MDEMPSLVRLYNNYKDKGLQIVGINVDDDPQIAIPKIHQKFNIPFLSKADREGELSEKFNATSLPTTVIIDRDRKILYSDSGDEDWTSASMIKQVETWLGNVKL
jgi:peroxiredoxin